MRNFIDLFAGCGGLSLGLTNAGWTGVFAIEKSPDAFLSLKTNLIDKNIVSPFHWPKWLPCQPMTTSDLLQNYYNELMLLNGKIDLIAGGPPCQGFSFAGKRDPNDIRNKLTEEYIKIVDIVRPKYLLLENVKGFDSPFAKTKIKKPYSQIVKQKLQKLGYTVYYRVIKSSIFGVPQLRQRFIMIAVCNKNRSKDNPFDGINLFAKKFKTNKNINQNIVSVKQAIGDLEVNVNTLIDSPENNGFKEIKYISKNLTDYQKLMRFHCTDNEIPNSLRLARHKKKTLEKFNIVLHTCEKGKSLDKDKKRNLGMKKQCFTPLHPNLVSKTITTCPDDLLHYSEPRILTVRENARIQSFPDWFEFMGKYTTGGLLRREECPRYTQVGNAVPPLLAEALGKILIEKFE